MIAKLIQLFKVKPYCHLILYGLFLEVSYLILLGLTYYKDFLGIEITLPSLNGDIAGLFLQWSLLITFIYTILVFKNIPKNYFWLIVVFYLIFSATLLFSWPFGSSDIFNYVYRARVFTEYGQNPYLVPPVNFPNDIMASFVYSRARYYPMIYGPLWTLISFIPTLIFKNSVVLALFSFKFIAVLANLGCLVLVYQILKILRPSYSHFGLLIYAWNPLVLFESAQNGHNDFLMLFLILLAVYLFIKGKLFWVLPVLTLSILVKYVTIILVPFFLIFLFKKLEKQRILFLIKACIFSLFLFFIFYLPFWSGFETLSPILSVSIFWGMSVFPAVIKLIFNLSFDQLSQLLVIIFSLIYVWCLAVSVYSKKVDLVKIITGVLLAFISIYLTWVMPWYFIWPMIFATLLITEKKYIYLILLLTGTGLIGNYVSYFLALLFLLAPLTVYLMLRESLDLPVRSTNQKLK